MTSDFTSVLEKVGSFERVALFDLDSALFEESFALRLAQKAEMRGELNYAPERARLATEERLQEFAQHCAGLEQRNFEEAAEAMPLRRGAQATVVGLRRAGFCVGIVSDGFAIAAETVRRRLGADFAVGHDLHFQHDRASGAWSPSPLLRHAGGCRRHGLCKINLLMHLREHCHIEPTQVLAVGNGDYDRDLCLLCASGFAVAVRPANQHVNAASAHAIYVSLTEILDLVLDPDEEAFVTPPSYDRDLRTVAAAR